MTYNEILEKFSFENVLKMHSFIPYVSKKEMPHITAYPNLILESEGMISNSDRKLQAATLNGGQIILEYFSEILFAPEIIPDSEFYNATIYGIYEKPKKCHRFQLDINNDWIDYVNVYVSIDGTDGDDMFSLGDNTTKFILIDPDNSGKRENPLCYNEDNTRLKYGSVFIKYIEIIDTIKRMGILSLDLICNSDKSKILKELQGILMHEICHLYYLWRNGVQQKDIVYDLTAFNKTYLTVYNNVSYSQNINVKHIITNINNKFIVDFSVKNMNVDEVAHFFKGNDLFGFIYMLNDSEIHSRLENFKKEISYEMLKDIIADYKRNKNNKKFYTLEESILSYSTIYQLYMLLAKVLHSMRDNLSEYTKRKFLEKFGKALSLIYNLKNDENLFENVIDLFLECCHYFMHDAGAYISRRIDTIINRNK